MTSITRALTLVVIAGATLPAVAPAAAADRSDRGERIGAQAKKAQKKKGKKARRAVARVQPTSRAVDPATAERLARDRVPAGGEAASISCSGERCAVIYRDAGELCVMTVDVARVSRFLTASIAGGPTCGEFVVGDPRPDA